MRMILDLKKELTGELLTIFLICYAKILKMIESRIHTMANRPQQITFTLTAEQASQLEELKKLTGSDTTNVFRTALSEYYAKMMQDEEGKKIAKINAMLDVQ